MITLGYKVINNRNLKTQQCPVDSKVIVQTTERALDCLAVTIADSAFTTKEKAARAVRKMVSAGLFDVGYAGTEIDCDRIDVVLTEYDQDDWQHKIHDL